MPLGGALDRISGRWLGDQLHPAPPGQAQPQHQAEEQRHRQQHQGEPFPPREGPPRREGTTLRGRSGRHGPRRPDGRWAEGLDALQHGQAQLAVVGGAALGVPQHQIGLLQPPELIRGLGQRQGGGIGVVQLAQGAEGLPHVLGCGRTRQTEQAIEGWARDRVLAACHQPRAMVG